VYLSIRVNLLYILFINIRKYNTVALLH